MGTSSVSGARLVRNTIWNLLGSFIPLFVGLAVIPTLIAGFGKERFGILSIAWMVIGYFSLFDIGLGRAMTKLVAEKVDTHHPKEIVPIAWTALALMGVLGLVGMVVLSALTPLLVHRVLRIPAEFKAETTTAFFILAFAIPVLVSTSGMRGLLEAHHRFDLVNYVRVPLGVFSFLGPLVVLPFSKSLAAIILVLAAGRLIVWGVYLAMCLRVLPELRRGIDVRRSLVEPLLGLGSWMTVSNMIGPVMVQMDRLLIGAVLSMTAVTFYTTPYEVVTKLWLIPGALVGVLFPAFAATLAQDRARAAGLFGRGVNYVFFAIFPLGLLLVVFAREGLNVWLGPEFAERSTPVMQWLAAAVFANCLAFVPSSLVQSAGRPDLAARVHLIELPAYLALLWWLLKAYGIVGVAVAWTIRVFADTVVFFLLVRSILPQAGAVVSRTFVKIAAGLAVLLVASFLTSLWSKVVFVIAVLLAFSIVAWSFLFTRQEREELRKLLRLASVEDAVAPIDRIPE